MTDHDTEDHLEDIPLDALPLDGWHRARGARMVPFAGYEMPIQYEGIVAEHTWEEFSRTGSTKGLAPFWRVVESSSPMAKKLNFDAAWIDLQQDLEKQNS